MVSSEGGHAPTAQRGRGRDGPWTVEIEGTPTEVAATVCLVVMGRDEGYAVHVGCRPKGLPLYEAHLIQRLSSPQPIAKAVPAELDKKRVKARITVGKDSLRLTYDGVDVLKATKEAGFGRLALAHLDGFSGTVTISGRVQPGWINGLLDSAVAEQRARFDRSYVDPPGLAAWKDVTAPADSSELTFEDLVERIRLQPILRLEQAAHDHAVKLIQRGPRDAASVLAQLDQRDDLALRAPTKAYLRFLCALKLRRPTLALAQLEQVPFEPADAGDVALLEAWLLREAGRLEASLDVLRSLTAHPEVWIVARHEAEVLLLLGRPAAAQDVVQRGLAARPASGTLRDLATKVVKAMKGPVWQRTVTEKGVHFTVHTDGDPKLARTGKQVLDEAWSRCAEFFGALPAAPTEPSTVYLFASQDGYSGYAREVTDGGHESTQGVYCSQLKQIAAWNPGEEAVLRHTLRHECAHRYVDLLVGSRLPRWLDEGLAEVFAASWDAKEKFAPGGLHRHWIGFFAQGPKLRPLAEFVLADTKEFLADGERGYAQAWALIHFLRHVDAEGQRAMQQLWTAVSSGTDGSEAIANALPDHAMGALQERFIRWLRLQRPR